MILARRLSWLSLVVLAACDPPAGSASPTPPASAVSGASSASAAGQSASAVTAGSVVPPAAPAARASAAPAASSAGAAAAPKADPGRLSLEGKVIQGGLVRARLNGRLKLMSFAGHKAIVSDEGDFLIAFARTAPPTQDLTITFDDGSVLEHVFQIEQRTYETDTVNGLSEDMVDLDAPTHAKLAQIEPRIEAARKVYSKKPCYKDGFVWPAKGKITSRYGQPRVLNGKEGGIHWGVDVAAPVGTPVRAPACGKVVFAEKDVPLSGHLVIVDHGHGLTSSFLHLSSFRVKVGDELKQGAVIGAIGTTGRATGPHLDWRMNFFETRVDPELLVPGPP